LASVALVLAACSPPATSTGQGGSATQAAPSTLGGGPTNIQPGQYRTTVTILAISVPGITPQQIQAMQAQPMTDEDCVADTDINELARKGLIRSDEGETCSDNHMTAANGHIEGAATCTNAGGDTRSMQMTGSYTGTHVEMD